MQGIADARRSELDSFPRFRRGSAAKESNRVQIAVSATARNGVMAPDETITVERAVPSVYVRRPVFAPTPRGMGLWKLGLVPLDSVGGHQQEHMRIGRLDETLKLGVNDTSYG
jgi:hypothetical protein